MSLYVTFNSRQDLFNILSTFTIITTTTIYHAILLRSKETQSNTIANTNHQP